MLPHWLRHSLGRFLQRFFPNDHTRKCFEILDQYAPKFGRETKWPYVREMATNAIIASRGASQRNSKILGPAASTLSTIHVVVLIEFTRLGPRYQTMDGPAQLSSLFNIGLEAIDELYGGDDDATDLYIQEMADLKRHFDSAMARMSTEFLTKRGRTPL